MSGRQKSTTNLGPTPQTRGSAFARFKAAALWAWDRLDPLAALVAGAAATFAGLFGWLSSEQLATATLGVLVVVALSLVHERTLRLGASRRIDEALAEIIRTRQEIKQLDAGHPYHVVVSESTWDIHDDGSVHVLRWKKLRFSQNDVIAVVDWSAGDGEAEGTRYEPGQVVHTFTQDGRLSTLVALDRPYARDEERDLIIERHRRGAFLGNPDRVWVLCLDPTSLMKLTVRWPPAHPPRQVRFIRRNDREPGRPLVVPPVISDVDQRSEYTAEIPEPALGERFCIEWDWDPPLATRETTTTGALS